MKRKYETNADRQRAYRQRKRNATPKHNVTPMYQDNLVALYHGDCNHVTPSLPSGSIDAVVTDAPYGASGNGVVKHKDKLGNTSYGVWDVLSKKELLANYHTWASEWHRLLRPGGALVVLTGRSNANNVDDILREHGFFVRNTLLWIKANPSPAQLARRNLVSAYEIAIWATKPGATYTFNRQAWYHLNTQVDNSNVIVMPSQFNNRLHPTQKPEALMGHILDFCTNEGDTVLDPFAGSGTTLAAARLRGLRSIGIEQDATYCQRIVERLSQAVLTG